MEILTKEDKRMFFNNFLEGDFEEESTWEWTGALEKIDPVRCPWVVLGWLEELAQKKVEESTYALKESNLELQALLKAANGTKLDEINEWLKKEIHNIYK